MSANQYESRQLKSKSQRKVSTMVLLTYLLIIVLLTTGISFSRYTSADSGGSSARVAKFSVLDDLGEQFHTIKIAMAPGDEPMKYPIKISNDSEVAVRYTLEVIRETENLPLEIRFDGNLANQATGQLAANADGNADVELSVSWQEDDAAKDYRYSHEIDLVTVKLTVEQID